MRSSQQARTFHIVREQANGPVLTWEPTSLTSDSSLASPSEVSLIVGDAQDDAPNADTYLGNAVKVQVDAAGEVSVRTSLTGFPPVYCYDGPGPLVLSSSVKRIASTAGVTLEFDAQGVAEWIRIGKPIGHRTLFRHVRVLPGGVTIRLPKRGQLAQTHEWSAPQNIVFSSYDDYLDAQIDAFSNAMHRMDTHHSFLSLTAGLDTRAVLATLILEGRSIDAVTMSGKLMSLDARRARALCKVLGLRHTVVQQDDAFLDLIEERTLEAVQLSGGLAGLDGALEVHMYRVLGLGHGARLSGNLGNQVGRSGTEGVGTRGLSAHWFADDVRAAIRSLSHEHWHLQIAQGTGGLGPEDLIQRESLFASLANATIGSALAIQQTPYADRRMIENKCAEPALPDNVALSARVIRMRDLRHRVFGEPVSRSFQRRIVNAAGGPVADIPINWGWRPRGGLSMPGLFLGGAAGLDALLSKRQRMRRLLRPLSQLTGLQGLSGFGSEPLWQTPNGMTFAKDTLRDAVNRSHPLLACSQVSEGILNRDITDASAAAAAQLLTLVLVSQEFGVTGGLAG